MSYRRYPNRERALHQLDRHHQPAPLSEFQIQMAEQARLALENAQRQMRPFAEAMQQMASAAPALLEQAAPAASRFIAALKTRPLAH